LYQHYSYFYLYLSVLCAYRAVSLQRALVLAPCCVWSTDIAFPAMYFHSVTLLLLLLLFYYKKKKKE